MAKLTQQKSYSKIGLLILAVLLVAIVAASQTMLRSSRLDLTENQLYTLSDGTKDVLQNLAEPVNLYFFYSRDQASKLGQVQTWGRRVEELLSEMQRASNGKLTLQIIEPTPFSEQEDQATALGVEAVPINNLGDTLYLGLAGTNALDGSDVIPFLQPNRESQLEYDITKMVYELGVLTKPVVGVLSSLPVFGGKNNPVNGQRSEPWLTISQMEQFFEVQPIADTATELPDDLGLLVLIHPTNLAESMLYAIDQYVLGGGKALVFVDPNSEVAMRMGGAGMLNPDAASPDSSLDKLLPNWGARLIKEKVLGDADYALGLQTDPRKPPEYHVTLLGLRGEAINQDDTITSGLETLNLGVTGALEPVKDSGIEFLPLLQSSANSGLIDTYIIQPGISQREIQAALKIDDDRYTIAARLRGKAKSAFPDGKPTIAGANDEDIADEPENFVQAHQKQSAGDINVVVVADSDMLTDRYWAQVQNQFGQQVIQPVANNLDFLLAAVDNLLGSSALIGIRSRAGYSRPFEKVNELKREANAKYQAKQEELESKLKDIEASLTSLRNQGDGTAALTLDENSQNQLQNYMNERMEVRTDLRSVQHELDSDIKMLGNWLRFWNIAFVPLLLTLLALCMVLMRRRTDRAAAANRSTTRS